MTSSSTQSSTVIQLFRKWRSGDEASGQEMAQRFSDWYYAISTIRVPGQAGRAPMEQACQAFAQGIVSVTRPRALVDWAHDLLERELQGAGFGMNTTESTGSDHPNAMTRNRSPSELIQNVAAQLNPEHRNILALAYDTSVDLSAVDGVADALGGTPFAILNARYELKRILRDTQDVPFAVVPDKADMDRVPISLYEAQRLASEGEIADLEKWLLSDIDLCKDIAEFSAFVHALRGGALGEWAVVPEVADPQEATAAVPEAKPAPSPEPEPISPEVPTEGAEPVSAQPEPPPAKPSGPSATDSSSDLDTDDSQEAHPEVPDVTPSETPSPSPPAPASKGSTLKGILITGATITGAIVLLLMIMIYALRAG